MMARADVSWLAALVAAAACCLPAQLHAAEDGADRATQVAFEVRHEAVDRGLDDWRGLRLSASHAGTWTTGWHGALVHEQRFGRHDAGIEMGGFLPLDEDWMLQAEAGAVPDADFLPHGYAELRMTRRLPKGWLASGGVRRSRYPTATVDRLSLDAERYIGAWRVAYGYDLSRLDDANLSSHELAVDRYYGERNVVGVRFGAGDEASQRPGGALLATGARSAWVRGTHWMAKGWAVDWAAGQVDQEAAYDRSWLQLGIRKEL